MDKKQKPYSIGPGNDARRMFGERPQKRGIKGLTFSKVLCIFSDVLLAYCLFLTSYAVFKYFNLIQSEEVMKQPELSFLGYLLPAAFVFAGLTHTFYYNKERFANCITLRFEYIKQLLLFKLNSGLYSQEELTVQVDNAINQAEIEADALIANDMNSAEQEQTNIVL